MTEETRQTIKTAVDNFYDALNSRYSRLSLSGLVHLDDFSEHFGTRKGTGTKWLFTYYTTVGSIEDYGLAGIFDDLPPREDGMGEWLGEQGAIRGFLRACIEEHVPEGSDFCWVSEESDAPYFKLDRVAFVVTRKTASVG